MSFQSQFIEVGIGIVFVFLLMSVMVSSLNELWAMLRADRGKGLKNALTLALNDPLNKNWIQLIYDHPLIDTLKKSEKRPPSYISSSSFATALMEVIAAEADKDQYIIEGEQIRYVQPAIKEKELMDRFKKGLEYLRESDTKTLLTTFVRFSDNDPAKLKFEIEKWFNEYMDRVSGWYKRGIMYRLIIFSAILTVVMNVNTITLSNELWNNAVLRQSIGNAATAYVNENNAATTTNDSTLQQKTERIKNNYQQLGMLNLPIGWKIKGTSVQQAAEEYSADPSFTNRIQYWWEILLDFLKQACSVKMIFGWAFTCLAVSFGAPYWFDILNRLVRMKK